MPKLKQRKRNDFYFIDDKESQGPQSFAAVDRFELQMLLVELKQGADVEFDQFSSWDVALDSVLSDLVVDVVVLVGIESQNVDVFLVGVVFVFGIDFLVVSVDDFFVVFH